MGPSPQQKIVGRVRKIGPSRELARKRHFEANPHWNGISVTNGNLNFDSAVDLSKLPAPIIATIKTELGLKLSDLSDVSGFQYSIQLILVRAFENDYPSAPTKSDSLT